MPMRAAVADRHPPKPASAVTAPDDIALFDMANLPTEKTGVDRVIYISTAPGSHGPRMNWYPARPARDAPCRSITIEPAPQSFSHHLPNQAFDAAHPAVAAWVTLNAAALLDFWDRGSTWLDDEVTAVKQALRKLPPRG